MVGRFIRLAMLAMSVSAAAPQIGPALEASDYRVVQDPCDLSFPKDHGPHPGYRSEWWYYTGNLRTSGGRHFGYQVTIFRYQMRPLKEIAHWPDPASAWRTQQILIGHAAISDMNTRQHHQAETVAREALGMAAAGYANKRATIFVGNYYIRINQLKHIVRVLNDDFRIDLQLEPQKPLVLHGKQGYSRKGDTPANASCYYSFPRLLTRGAITVGGATEAVSGLSWMDHEFSTAPLQADLVGWDWFSLQLDNNTELMLYLLRYADGHYHSASSGSFIDPKGQVTPLAAKEITIKGMKTWRSSVSNGTYPISWQVKIPAISLQLNIQAQLADQEMHTAKTTGVVYWEGSVRADGKLNGQAVKGEGYVELTGYAHPFKAPL